MNHRCMTERRPAPAIAARRSPSPVLNDVHARMNPTVPALHRRADSLADVLDALQLARRRGLGVAIAGGRHAMGGQQFLDNGVVLDMRGMNRIVEFDPGVGRITCEAGATWPELMRGYLARQAGRTQQWGVRQKQTGADGLTLGGAVAANIHGRGLDDPPFSADVESLQLVSPDGEVVTCSRDCRPELFRLVVGGYGLFGVVTTVTLLLVPRRKVERVVGLLPLRDLIPAFQSRIEAGFLYGDFQFATDPTMRGFLEDGVFSCYRAVEPDRPIPPDQLRLHLTDWRRLLYLAHVNKRRAFVEFADFYLRSSGQLYWSDTHQLNIYLDDYHRPLDSLLDARVPGSEMITELYVPRARLGEFMADVRHDFRRHAVDLVYGTIRLIRRDDDAFLAWAREDYACVIFNLHVDHDASGIARARVDFQRLIDRAIEHGGSYFLTYHRFARRDQLLACYPQMPEFLRRKRALDPDERLSSNWYRHHTDLLSDLL
jgi:FAD/FMN-containing dehydrogenase